MAFYTVMIPPPDSGGPREEIERARLLPERFAWGAFVFTGLWLLSKKLWLWTLFLVLVWGALLYAERALRLPGGTLTLIHLSIALYLGLEGHNLVQRKLARKGWRLVDVVEAPDLASAERRYFERALDGTAAPRAEPRPQASRLPAGPTPVIGLFPEASR